MLAAPQIKDLVALAKTRWPNLHCTVYPIVNDFFGHTITVAGLITGQDMIAQLKGRDLGERLLFPDVMLRFHTDVFLDDITQGQIEEALGVPMVSVQADDGYELLRNILGE
jgi:NifB/MoaA-like Fe-S oxidoreductase